MSNKQPNEAADKAAAEAAAKAEAEAKAKAEAEAKAQAEAEEAKKAAEAKKKEEEEKDDEIIDKYSVSSKTKKAIKNRTLSTAEEVMSFFGLNLLECTEENIANLKRLGLTKDEIDLVLARQSKEVKIVIDTIPAGDLTPEVKEVMMKYGVVAPDFADKDSLKGKIGRYLDATEDGERVFEQDKEAYKVVVTFINAYVAKKHKELA